ncbi:MULTISPECIES: hypothetical protein [Halorussus]|uniref:hypothetical protein n=1 Tax=Halorussus TaxID=1070314 RepID=UPI000E21A2AD|nr:MULTISPECIES: hypothetical protein [Halorussus]NHN59811.1 hypothetical protein [Halorussus sp. JP-T4]
MSDAVTAKLQEIEQGELEDGAFDKGEDTPLRPSTEGFCDSRLNRRTMPSTRLVYRVVSLSVLVCVCSSTAIASFGVVHGTTNNAATGCFPGVDSIERGEAVGDVVEMKMLLCFTGSVTIEGPGYSGKATLGDGNNSGHVTLHLDTGVNGSAVFDVTSDRLDSVPMNATGDGSFEPGNYTVTIRDGSGDVADTITFELDEPQSRTNVTGDGPTVYRAANASFESVASIEDAISTGRAEPADAVAVGDTLIVAIESEQLADAMNTTNGSTTEQFFTALNGKAEFRIIQTNPTPEANRKFAAMGQENVTAHRVGTTVYAVVETENLTVKYRRVLRETQFDSGDRFAVQFGYDLPDTWSRATVPSSPIIEFQPRSQLTTTQSQTTTRPETPIPSTHPESETSTLRGSTTSEQVTSKGTSDDQAETSGVPGFTAPTTLLALLGFVVLWIQRSYNR